MNSIEMLKRCGERQMGNALPSTARAESSSLCECPFCVLDRDDLIAIQVTWYHYQGQDNER